MNSRIRAVFYLNNAFLIGLQRLRKQDKIKRDKIGPATMRNRFCYENKEVRKFQQNICPKVKKRGEWL
ncbi:MAG TPA: hypothetical protein DF614_06980 [Methylococcaceae bacterium]|nr:hypothetical protein [Methylococcaceae bacterium]